MPRSMEFSYLNKLCGGSKGRGCVGEGGILLLVTCVAAGPLAGHPLASWEADYI